MTNHTTASLISRQMRLEEESNVNKNEQTLEELEGEEVSNLIEDLRESNWIQHLLQQNQLHMTGLMNTSGKI